MRYVRCFTSWGGTLLGILALAGCNPQDAQNIGRDTAHLARDTGQAVGSAGLATKINTALSMRKGISMSGLHVDVQGGVVTLGGHVRNAEERRRVVQTVQDTTGVDKVIDNLRIQP